MSKGGAPKPIPRLCSGRPEHVEGRRALRHSGRGTPRGCERPRRAIPPYHAIRESAARPRVSCCIRCRADCASPTDSRHPAGADDARHCAAHWAAQRNHSLEILRGIGRSVGWSPACQRRQRTEVRPTKTLSPPLRHSRGQHPRFRPLADGGRDSLVNLQSLCRTCHRAKSGQEQRDRLARRRAEPARRLRFVQLVAWTDPEVTV